MKLKFLQIVLLLLLIPRDSSALVLDKQKLLDVQTFWDNKDWDWYKENIPFFDSPDSQINTTYYYRWELLTKHLTYGSPNSGYSFTEFIDRPFWSGAYGSISCPAGHQIYESRWLRQSRIPWDFARYWFFTKGAEPRKMSSWLTDAIWNLQLVHVNNEAMASLFPEMRKNQDGWDKEHFDADVGLYWQTGHDDGMEFNVNSRQTTDILHGGPGYRPTLNSYMWADLTALSKIAAIFNEPTLSKDYQRKAEAIRHTVETKLWDPTRQFFFPMSKNDEVLDGFKVLAHTLTYQSGKFAKNPHGRELLGYIPWQFSMPENRPELAQAWKYLMQPEYFLAPFGPTTLEQKDPLFQLQKSWCCWWSGQSWPYATSQTLKGMANLLQKYSQSVVTSADYVKLLKTFAKSHTKNNRPYLAEALNPQTGSFEGHDAAGHSEHYFHSSYIDLIVTGLVGLQPRDDDTVEIFPLAPKSWDFFALDDLAYHGHLLSIVWDKSGKHYGKGAGLQIWADGTQIASSAELAKLSGKLPPLPSKKSKATASFNFAVNNDGAYFPRVTASTSGPDSQIRQLNDGSYWYHTSPRNRWVTEGIDRTSDWIIVDFGTPRPIDTIKLYLLDDGKKLSAPTDIKAEFFKNGHWQNFPNQVRQPTKPKGHRANVISFARLDAEKIRISMAHEKGHQIGLSEIETWGEATFPIAPPPSPSGNLAFGSGKKPFPKVIASFTSTYDNLIEVNDGKIVFAESPSNRWTTYGSPNKEEWIEIDFGEPKSLSRLELAFYDDSHGVKAPQEFEIEMWKGDNWQSIGGATKSPLKPQGGAINTVTFPSASIAKVRLRFKPQDHVAIGLTEIMAWSE